MKAFNNKWLEFLTFLSHDQHYMTTAEMAKKFVLKNSGKERTVSEMTIIRWINLIRARREFNYFPNFNAHNYDLIPIWVLCEGVRDKSIVDLLPYKPYIQYGTDLKTLGNVYLIAYQFPSKHIRKFEDFWKRAKTMEIFDNHRIFKCRSSIAFYPEYHKIFDESGNLSFDCESKEQDTYMALLKDSLSEGRIKTGIHQEIVRNPLIIPGTFELFMEPRWSSKRIWRNMKERMGDRAWDYFVKSSITEKKDGVAFYQIQKTIDSFVSSPNLFRQTRVTYDSLVMRNVGIYLIIKLKNKEAMKSLAEIVGKRSVLLVISPPLDLNELVGVYYFVTSPIVVTEILSSLSSFIDETYDNRVIWLDFEKCLKLALGPPPDISRNNIEYDKLFDPIEVCWKYDHQKYLEKLG